MVSCKGFTPDDSMKPVFVTLFKATESKKYERSCEE